MKKEKKVWAISLIALGWLAPQLSIAQQYKDTLRVLNEVVVTGTKFDLPVEKSGKFILKLNEQQLRAQSGRGVGELLNNLAGVQVDGNFGTPGTNLNYYIRGARNRQTLVLLDGIPMNDPSGIDAFYDLRYVPTDQLKSMEVLQGGLSTLYGSGAAAAVINLQTKEATTNGAHGSVDVNAGSWGTYSQNVNVTAKAEKLSVQLMANNFSSEGFSAALDQTRTGNFDKDGIVRRNGLIKLGYQAAKNLKLDFFAGRDWFDAKYDDGPFRDASNNQILGQTRVGLKALYSYRNGSLQFIGQQLNNNREFKSSFPSIYEGFNSFAEMIHAHQINRLLKVLSGVNFQQLKFGQKNQNVADTTKFTIIDPYASLLLETNDGFTLHTGVRLNTHSQYGSKLLYNVNPSYTIKSGAQSSLKVFASVSSSFITPSLFQLFSPFGNKNLKPEENFNYEYGATFTRGGFTVSGVNFFRDEANTIGFLTSRYENLSIGRRVSGVTIDGNYLLNYRWSVRADFTFQDTDAAKTFLRIPNQKWGMGVSFRPTRNALFAVSYLYTGARTDLFFDQNFVANDIALAAYDLINLSAAHDFFKGKLSVYGLLNNLLDREFVGVYGFTTQGRNATIGVRYSF